MYITVAACILVIVAAEVQAIHTVRRCDSKYNNLLQQAASVHQDCGDPSVYNCCSLATFFKTIHGYSSAVFHQTESACEHPNNQFGGRNFNLARCDMKSDNGGWTVIFRRDASLKNRVNFDRDWNNYENGFGDLETEFWYGLREMHCLTQTDVEMRLDLTFNDKTSIYWTYGLFTIDGAEEKYRLRIGQPVGSPGAAARDAFTDHRQLLPAGNPFSTKDMDNDQHSTHCAGYNNGGWWWHGCSYALLTKPDMSWNIPTIKPLSLVEMKIRPKSCTV